MKVLIVDDEPHIRLLLEQALEELEDEGVELLMATNGQEALDRIAEERPSLVLLDVMMPLVNGMDVCRRVKGDPELASIPVMMLTAKGQDLDRQAGMDVGADRYVTKPFDPDDVLEQAAEMLGIEL
ncbi:MAG: response regulator [Myxococcales bacterium]|nr:response regulator [Myxococcales bacterium]MCB9670333.1 response regulator [Alphaproteobacteria bacterium]MCB9693412.1 response regulator [Alphaproteobacteria bacterium]